MDAKSIVSLAITGGLETLGESSAMATIYFVKRSSKLQLEDFLEHPNELCLALRGIFGPGSASLLRTIGDKIESASHVSNQGERKKLEIFSESIRECIKTIEAGIL